ncbi:MAG: hypothetical protein ACLTLY_05920 [Agathobacter rectalis]
MDRIDYIKYSRSKALEYQTRTSIGVSGGKRIVEKSPLYFRGHCSYYFICKKHDKLQNVYLKVKPVDVILKEKSVYFPFIDGESLYDYLEDSITDTSELIKRIKNALMLYLRLTAHVLLDGMIQKSLMIYLEKAMVRFWKLLRL